jgi:hypothetical protein
VSRSDERWRQITRNCLFVSPKLAGFHFAERRPRARSALVHYGAADDAGGDPRTIAEQRRPQGLERHCWWSAAMDELRLVGCK